jgi:glucose/arabinose dehydrogenase
MQRSASGLGCDRAPARGISRTMWRALMWRALMWRALMWRALIMTGAACASPASLPVDAGTGPNPQLPTPRTSLIPTINVVTARGWPAGRMPTAATGLDVTPFATNLQHPRWLYVLPNGDVLVAETNAPPRKERGGIRGWMFRRKQKQAGGAVPSPNRVTLLRDTDGDGRAELRTVLLEDVQSPFGMTLVGGTLYVALADAVVAVPYREGDTTITATPRRLLELPGGPINHHWTKNIIASPDGRTLYIAVGSNSNAAESGMAVEAGRAAIWSFVPATGQHAIYASGLRNPVGMAFEPTTGALWTTVNERDELGSDLVPDYMTSVRAGGFYGWPYSYFGQHVDTRVKPQRPDLVATAIVPDYALGPHTASLGLAWMSGGGLGDSYREGMVVGQHGSWNREPRSGYKVIFVPFTNGKPSGAPIDLLTGFVRESGDAYGRPVGVAIDRRGAILVADDVGNAVWRVARRTPPS